MDGERERDRQTETETDRQTDTQTHRDRDTDRQTDNRGTVASTIGGTCTLSGIEIQQSVGLVISVPYTSQSAKHIG